MWVPDPAELVRIPAVFRQRERLVVLKFLLHENSQPLLTVARQDRALASCLVIPEEHSSY